MFKIRCEVGVYQNDVVTTLNFSEIEEYSGFTAPLLTCTLAHHLPIKHTSISRTKLNTWDVR